MMKICSTSVIRNILALILIFSVQCSLSASDYRQTFRGEVIDALTELPLPGATVIILGSDPLKGTATDADGRFRMENIPLGRLDIRVSMVGYQSTLVSNLLLTSGRELVITVRLEEKVTRLADVEVRPEVRKDQPVNEMALVSARSFTVEETERYAGSLGDPSRMAANFAGVSAPSDQRNDIVIRGNSPLGLLWRLEGVEIPNPNHFGSMGSTGGPVSMLNNNLLTNSDFYTGAFPAEYGNALAGAFDLRMRNGNSEQREYMGQVGFNGFELGAEGPFSGERRSSYLVNVRYSTMEALHALGIDFGTGTAIPEYKDISFKLNFPLKKGRITLFGLGGESYIEMLDSEGDDAQYGFSGTDLYFGARSGVAGLSHLHYVDEDTWFTTRLALTGIQNTSDIYDLGLSSENRAIIERDHEIRYSLSTKYSRRVNVRNFYQVGLLYDYFDIKYVGQEYFPDLGEYFYYMNTEGNLGMFRAFGEWQHRFSNQFSISSGLHASWFFLNNSYSLEPRLGMKWSFREGQSLSFGAGLHSQTQMKAIYFMEELVDTLNHIYQQTNRDLGFSRSLHLVTGYDRLLGEGHRLKTEIYYQRLYDIPVSPRRPEFSLLSQGAGFAMHVFHHMENEGTGENKGIELTLEKFLKDGFYYLFTASIFDSGYRGYDGVWRNSAFNNNFVFNVLAGYEWRLGVRSLLSLDANVVWAGGNRYLPIDPEASEAKQGVVFDWESAYEERYPDYFRVNARVTFRLNGKNVNQEWGVDLQNLTNQQNIFTENWNNHEGRITTAYQMGFMPMMTYRIYF